LNSVWDSALIKAVASEMYSTVSGLKYTGEHLPVVLALRPTISYWTRGELMVDMSIGVCLTSH